MLISAATLKANDRAIIKVPNQPALRPAKRLYPTPMTTVPSSGNSSTSHPKLAGVIPAVR